MKKRFGGTGQAILARITHRKQRENVQAYVDKVSMLFSQTNIPNDTLTEKHTSGCYYHRSNHLVPKTMEEVITNAAYVEEKATGAVAHRLKMWEQQQIWSGSDPVECSTKSMERMSISI